MCHTKWWCSLGISKTTNCRNMLPRHSLTCQAPGCLDRRSQVAGENEGSARIPVAHVKSTFRHEGFLVENEFGGYTGYTSNFRLQQ